MTTWTTPIRIASDEMWCVRHEMWSGSYEWICGREKADELLNGGMTKINGRPCFVSVVGEWPSLDAVQICARTSSESRETQYDWEMADVAIIAA